MGGIAGYALHPPIRQWQPFGPPIEAVGFLPFGEQPDRLRPGLKACVGVDIFQNGLASQPNMEKGRPSLGTLV